LDKLRLAIFLFALVLVASFVLACGAGAKSQSQEDPLVSITLSPTAADAQDYTNGQVQFVATGSYIDPSRTVTPLSATWGTCYQNAATSEVTVSAGGVAQCAPGAVGTYTIWADDPPTPGVGCLAINACGGGCFVVGSAQLTCP
jgi:hypothetical protein